MKTNITKLPKGNYGKLVGDALYCSAGCCNDDAEYDIANIYMLLDGSLIAESYSILFSVEETNWHKDQLFWKYHHTKKRGRHSRSNNKKRKRYRDFIDELPF